MPLVIKVTLNPEWKEMMKLLDQGALGPRLDRNLRDAHYKNGWYLKGEIKKNIKSQKYGDHAPNRPLTLLLKKGNTPLVEKGKEGFLQTSISFETLSANSMEIGVKKGHSMARIIEALHDGATIHVTDHMRGMFQVLADVSSGRKSASVLKGRALELYEAAPGVDWHPLLPSTTRIVIPPRPFLREVLEAESVQAHIGGNIQIAFAAAIAGTTPIWRSR